MGRQQRAEITRSSQLIKVANKAAQQVVAAKEVSKEQRKQRKQETHNLQEYMNEKIAKASPTKTKRLQANAKVPVTAATPPAPPPMPNKLEVVGVAASITK